MKRFLILLMILPLLAGCLTEADQGNEANQLVTAAHQAIKSNNWDQVTPLYDDEFLKAHSLTAWKQQVAELTAPLGKITNIKPTFEQHDPRFGGDFYLYGFILQFEHGSISETLTVYKAVNKEHMTISGHILKLKRHP
ncbi:MAG: hypothetical protein COW18_05655 [Zetaproteobacteria bacterium CG12_big_fil_rev_8_21_14_0_65_54_13]|nr:MAG: hypothetical protein COX55_07960 [Zetaproteobacteria bacterium CG23_combo_of_CG06-09_8_20_14_all_54_7]PIW49334.1 MAG: hypothetical protein COW18_05655 [Zetaproteobacteria bacterium CG12_big_fil_rev_8_21_14_0_65_54_13]PIX54001.1 MAG: hypothetical protein COZ50_10285 [Zetaproteobacteria bacterium CG_4_10_14_3_um_filter_54_28]PJA29882.1 MAG: hypothetical protein CO188_05470 [Zetaproteobacteria bacterium CG_4_9_14_3_um_filter_54_145]